MTAGETVATAGELVPKGTVDQRELDLIRRSLASEVDSFADYLTVSEISHLTRLSKQRIYHALNHAHLRPLSGIQRGRLWFIHRLDALGWARLVAQYELTRWKAHSDRLDHMFRREQGETYRVGTPKLSTVPDGVRVYTYREAAAALVTTRESLYVYLTAGNQLGHVRRYRNEHGQRVVDAEQIDEYMNTRRTERRAATREVPTLELVRKEA